jgi:hypothetical protein
MSLLMKQLIERLTSETFGVGMIPSLNRVLDYVDAFAHQPWDVKHEN